MIDLIEYEAIVVCIKSLLRCEFRKLCPLFRETSPVCTEGGGSYCGKYRSYALKRMRTKNEEVD